MPFSFDQEESKFGRGAHSANFDEKVHKPQSYRTLEVARVKKANHAEKQKTKNTWYLSIFYIFYMFFFFYPEVHNLSRCQKKQATLCSDFTEMLD